MRFTQVLLHLTSAIAGAAVAALLLTSHRMAGPLWPKSSVDLAAWVQAVGSIAAIGAGFLLAYLSSERQAREARMRDHETMRRAVSCIQSEVRLSWQNLSESFDAILNSPIDEDMVLQIVEYNPLPSAVFSALIDQIAALPDERMREVVIETYAVILTVGEACKTRNSSLKSLQTAYNNGVGREEKEHWHQDVCAQNSQLKILVGRLGQLASEVAAIKIPAYSEKNSRP